MKTEKERLEIQSKHQFDYMMLGRYEMDVSYYLGHGNRYDKHLYFGDPKVHINEMIKLWKRLPYKPTRLTAVKLIEYKSQMLLNNS